MYNDYINSLINKFRLLGFSVEVFPTFCKHETIVLRNKSGNCIWCIPDDVEQIRDKDINSAELLFNPLKCTGELRVIGGYGLEYADNIFSGFAANKLNLDKFSTSNVVSMHKMFYFCNIDNIDLAHIDTSKVTDMSYMFYGCKAKTLNLHNFDTRNVENMNFMFSNSLVESLDLSSFNTSKVKNMANMFQITYELQGNLDLSSFDTHNVTTMEKMFFCCTAESINLKSFDTSNVDNMNGMFAASRADILDLSSFDVDNVRDMSAMFMACTSKIKTNNKRIQAEYDNRK